MTFKWNKEKEELSIPSPPDFNETDDNNKISCDTFSTCPKYNEEELKEFQRIKACWDNIGNIKYDKDSGCFYMIEECKNIFLIMEYVLNVMKYIFHE